VREQTAELVLPLPADFNRDAFLDFHRRDVQAVAEKVDAGMLVKAFIWQQVPTLLTVAFHEPGQARITLQCDAEAPSASVSLDAFARHLLGLDQPTQEFEAQTGRHPLVGAMVRTQAGLRVPQSASPFEALSWAIIGQQISVAAPFPFADVLYSAWAAGTVTAFTATPMPRMLPTRTRKH
tara:strand:- start:1343 stop:1882 length:540 start_codon:yes stop_codon:yes gene_type:complete